MSCFGELDWMIEERVGRATDVLKAAVNDHRAYSRRLLYTGVHASE